MNQASLIMLSVVGAGLILILPGWWLPPVFAFTLLMAIGIAAFIALRWIKPQWVWPVVAISLGAAVSVWQVNAALSQRMPTTYFGQDLEITLKVHSVVDERPQRQIIIAETLSAPRDVRAQRWRIAWYGVAKHDDGRTIELAPGDVWRMNLRIRSLTGNGNPGSFDSAAWYLRTRIDGAAYVRNMPKPVRLERGDVESVHGWRSLLAKRVTELSTSDKFDHVVVALTLGFRAGVDESFQELLRQTGTAHLLAISGLHIGLVSAAGFVVFKMLWGLFPHTIGRRYSRSVFAGVLSVCLAIGYAVLAGSNPSTLRAVSLCVVVFFVVWQRLSVSLWLPFSLSLAFVVFTDVLRLLSPGVWLSFGTVGLILVLHRPNSSSPRIVGSLARVWRTHAALGLCLLPITGWFFSQGSLIAPLANLIAVPVVSFVVVPLSLLVILFIELAPGLAALCLSMANAVIGVLEQWLTLCAAIPLSNSSVAVPGYMALIAALLGAMCFCAPSALGVRRFCLPLCLPVIVWSIDARQVAGLEVHVLDVGQGHASLVLTENHVVLVDTGGTLGRDLTHWEASVRPALRKLGRTNITHVVVSHSDSDHAAGATLIANQFPLAEFWLGGVSAVAQIPDAKRCVAGEHWRLDDVEFSFLHPARHAVDPAWIGQDVSDNDHSCVLLVQLGKSTVLFPGDLEQRGEEQLMDRLQFTNMAKNVPDSPRETAAPRSLALRHRLTLLVAPHHGSHTSSTPAFVDGWLPEHVVFPAGYRNRLGFPHYDVRMRYKEIGSVAYVTGWDGAVRFQLGPLGLLAKPTRYWDENRRLWHSPKR